jgi:hypothetical protein
MAGFVFSLLLGGAVAGAVVTIIKMRKPQEEQDDERD